MSKGKVTFRAVAALEPGKTLWDTAVRGFGVRRQLRAPVYVFKYRINGRQRFMTIGPHGSPWTPEAARAEATRLLGMLASKERPRDPANERDWADSQPTFAEFARKYLVEHAMPRKKPRSVSEDRRNLELHVLPALGGKKLSDITRADIARFHAARHAHPTNANRCLALISHIFTIAEKWGFRDYNTNPTRGLDRYRENRRDRLLAPSELARLGEALETARAGGTLWFDHRSVTVRAEDWRAIACFWLLIFTGARLSEILSLQWSTIQWQSGFARLPDSKTGAKNLALPEPALVLLHQLREKQRADPAPSKYVLPGERGNSHFIGIQKPWQRIRKAAGLTDVRIHDLRHCYASTAVAEGESLYLVGTILGHRQSATTQRYAHLAMDPVREVANRTANRLAELLRPKPSIREDETVFRPTQDAVEVTA